MKNVFRYSIESLDDFLSDMPMDEPQEEGKSSADKEIRSVDTLPVSIKYLIENGVKQGDRSEIYQSVLIAMIRAGIPENEIVETFDKEAIGEKYREKGAGKRKWLQDEIQRARDFVSKNMNNFSQKNEQNELNAIENREWHKWPVMQDAAYRGFAGRFTKLATNNSEADPSAVLMQFLMRFGVEVGAGSFLYVGDGKHYARSISVIVGASSKARKGTSAKPVSRLFSFGYIMDFKEVYLPASSTPGPLSSGEGLIYAVRDAVKTYKKGEWIEVDPGVDDKRLYVLDEEFGSCLSASKRDGNTLSTIIRCLWDSGDLSPLTKNNRIQATGAHIGIVSHITLAELSRKLEDVEAFTGFANRILWVCARRQKIVPFPTPMPDKELAAMQRELRKILDACKAIRQMELSEDARSMWKDDIYTELSKDHSGLVGAVINRAESQVLRLSMIYALLDASRVIEVSHLLSALAMWQYCEDSARFIFAGRDINPYSKKIIDLLSDGKELTTTDIYKAFSQNITKDQMEEAITELMSQNKIEMEKAVSDGPGRPKTVFRCVSGGDIGLDFSF